VAHGGGLELASKRILTSSVLTRSGRRADERMSYALASVAP
jgi:hypothetical protein